MDLLLGPLVHLLGYNARKKKMSIEFKKACLFCAPKLCHNLKEFNSCPHFDTKNAKNVDQRSVSHVLSHVQSITSWNVTYYTCINFECSRAAVCKLQEEIWQQMLDVKWFLTGCISIGAAKEALLLPSSKYGRMDL